MVGDFEHTALEDVQRREEEESAHSLLDAICQISEMNTDSTVRDIRETCDKYNLPFLDTALSVRLSLVLKMQGEPGRLLRAC